MLRKSQAEKHAAISVILKYDLLRQEELRKVVASKLSASAEGQSSRPIKPTLWELIFVIFADYLTGQTTLITDLHTKVFGKTARWFGSKIRQGWLAGKMNRLSTSCRRETPKAP